MVIFLSFSQTLSATLNLTVEVEPTRASFDSRTSVMRSTVVDFPFVPVTPITIISSLGDP